MKKALIYLGVTAGLGVLLTLISRFSVGFSEWYAVNIYPILVRLIGGFFGGFSFSMAEIMIILLIPAGIAGIVLFIIKIVKSKGERKSFLARFGVYFGCGISTVFLTFILMCGINYNRHTFLHDLHNSNGSHVELREVTNLDEWLVFLTLLDEFYTDFPDLESQDGVINRDENGVFVLTGDLSKLAPAAMRNLAETYPRMKVRFPRPKPILNSGLMSDAFLLGFFSPWTMEANYNRIAPGNERALTTLHELAHVSGFMREEEANFISFLAAKESGEPELVYSAYVYVLNEFSLDITYEEFEQLPPSFMTKFDYFREKTDSEWFCDEDGNYEYFHSGYLIPAFISLDWYAQNEFWWERYYNVTEVYDDDGEVVDVIVNVNPVVEAISDVSSSVNDTYLKAQGQEDGILSYARMRDLVMILYLSEMSEM
ncbi:MAG: DUF3810 domain-containing protein [Oscillospiraceae bacterium]|nr:DUF3810 domain-containing protein [Oscillospiraceae bacterium]